MRIPHEVMSPSFRCREATHGSKLSQTIGARLKTRVATAPPHTASVGGRLNPQPQELLTRKSIHETSLEQPLRVDRVEMRMWESVATKAHPPRPQGAEEQPARGDGSRLPGPYASRGFVTASGRSPAARRRA